MHTDSALPCYRQTQRPLSVRGRSHRAGRGFSLVEMMVAIMILTVGVLGLASTAAVVLRQMSDGSKQTLAATAALTRFELLRSKDCGSLSSGHAASVRGISEVWTIVATARARIVTDTVKWTVGGQEKKETYKSAIPCA